MSDPSADRDPFEVVAESFLERFRAGHRPSIEEYAARHPEQADQIRELLPALVMVEQDLSVDRNPASGGSRVDSLPSSFKGRLLGDFRIIREVGRGGMGVVYEAEQVSLGRRVALKVLPGHLAGDGTASERFRREAKAAARLHHTNIVPVFEVGRDGEVAYYAMQFIRGQGLDQIVEELRRLREPGPEADGHEPAGSEGRDGAATGTGPRMDAPSDPQGRGLDQTMGMLLTGWLAADASGVSARGEGTGPGLAGTEQFDPTATSGPRPDAPRFDVRPAPTEPGPSPSAVLPGGKHVSDVDTSGRRQPYFRSVAQIGRQAAQGLAYAHARGVVHRDIKPSNLLLDTEGVVWITDFGLAKADDDGLTASGDILGTLRYMAPERFQGEGDARADVYALGLTLYELLTLRPAYDSTDRLRLIETIKNEEPARPRSIDPRIPRDLETIVLKAIDKHPDHRYPTADALAEDLRRFLADEPIKARQISTSERYWRWARRNPVVAALGGVLTALMVLTTIGSLLAAARFSSLADRNRIMALSERSARQEASRQAKAEALARGAADQARGQAEKAEKEATEQSNRADREAEVARQNLFYAQMHLAHQAWREHRGLSNMHELLANWLPQGKSPDRRGWEWFYLNSLPYQNLRTFTENGVINRPGTLAWNIARNQLAEGTADGSIRIWDLNRERVALILRGPAPVVAGHEIRWLAWSPDGGRLAAGFKDGTVDVWEPGSGREPHVFRGHRSPVMSVAFSSDGLRLAAWGNNGRIKIWDIQSGRLTGDVDHRGGVRAGAWGPDNKLLAAGHSDGTVTISGAHAGDKVVTLRGHSSQIHALAWSPDGTRLVSTSYDHTAKVWDVGSGKMALGPLRHGHEITSVAWEPDGKRLATGSIDQTVKIWDTTTGRENFTLRGHLGSVTSLAWGPDGRLASGDHFGGLKVWDAIRDQESTVLPGHGVRATSVSWSPDGKRLASGGDDGKIRIWDPAIRAEVAAFKGHDERRVNPQFGLIRSLAWSPDGTHLASAGADGVAKVLEVPSGRELFNLPGGRGSVWSVAWSPDGTHLAVGSQDGTICVFEGLDQAPKVQVLKAHEPGRPGQVWAQGVRALAWSPQGDRLASGGPDRLIKVWDPTRGAELARMQGNQGGALSVAWSPDGKRLASAGLDFLVIAWDSETGRKLSTMRGHSDWVDSVAWSPDGTRLASAGIDNSVRIWDPQTGEETFVLRGNSGMFHDVSWNSDGRRLAAASSNGQIWIWDATRGFERDTTTRALPYIDRKAASGTARDEELRWYAESYIRAGKFKQARTLLKDNPDVQRSFRADPRIVAQVNAGVVGFRQGRFADAIISLQEVCDRLQDLRSALPDNPELARLHGTSLGFLAGSLRDSKRRTESLARFRESLAVYESLANPYPGDFYNMACNSAMVSALNGLGSPEDREKLEAQAVEYLRKAIAGNTAQILPQVATDHDLDPLRRRADFRDMMADAIFPSDPFTQPSPIAIARATPAERKIMGEALIAEGRTLEAIPHLASAWEGNPGDHLLVLKVAALQAWFHRDAELAAICRKAREFARGTGDAGVADAAAKSSGLRPPDDPTYCAATLALARSASELGKDSGNAGWFRMGLGIAEYRAGHDEAAAETFRTLIGNNPQISVTSAFYLAMTLSRQGKDDEARRVATEAISRMRPLPRDEANPLAGGANHDDLILWMACREATALLKIDPGPASPSKR